MFGFRVIECKGPTNTRVYTVAVYFRGRRLASAVGHSIQQAEMNAAKKALEISQGNNTILVNQSLQISPVLDLFPQLDHQKRVIAKSMKKQKYPNRYRRSRSRSISSTRSLSCSFFSKKSPERYSKGRFIRRSRSRSVEYHRQSSRNDVSSISSASSSPDRSPCENANKEGIADVVGDI